MSDRVTKADIVKAFSDVFGDRIATNIGGITPGHYNNRHNIGKVTLDYNPVYGGWVVEEYVEGTSGEGSAIRQPYGCRRRAGREMLTFLDGMRAGKDLASES